MNWLQSCKSLRLPTAVSLHIKMDPENLKGGILGKFLKRYHVNRPILRIFKEIFPKSAAKGGCKVLTPWTSPLDPPL